MDQLTCSTDCEFFEILNCKKFPGLKEHNIKLKKVNCVYYKKKKLFNKVLTTNKPL